MSLQCSAAKGAFSIVSSFTQALIVGFIMATAAELFPCCLFIAYVHSLFLNSMRAEKISHKISQSVTIKDAY